MQPCQTTGHKNALCSLRLRLAIRRMDNAEVSILNEYTILPEYILIKAVGKDQDFGL